MRYFTGMPILHDAEELLSFMREAPEDRVLKYASNLDSSDFDGAYATRTDDTVLVVCSMRSVEAKSIKELCDALLKQNFRPGRHQGEIAIIGCGEPGREGWRVPGCIQALMSEAENKAQGRKLSWAGYEGICVLPEHPEAEG